MHGKGINNKNIFSVNKYLQNTIIPRIFQTVCNYLNLKRYVFAKSIWLFYRLYIIWASIHQHRNEFMNLYFIHEMQFNRLNFNALNK